MIENSQKENLFSFENLLNNKVIIHGNYNCTLLNIFRSVTFFVGVDLSGEFFRTIVTELMILPPIPTFLYKNGSELAGEDRFFRSPACADHVFFFSTKNNF